MSNREKVKRAIFHRGAMAIAKYRNGDVSLYFCPLCGTGFLESSLEDKTLTLEHVPPENMGGKILVLTCKDCNNKSGSSIDAALADRKENHELHAALLGRLPIPRPKKIQLEIHGVTLNATMSRPSDTLLIDYSEKYNHPDAIAQVRAHDLVPKKQESDEKFSFKIEFESKYPEWFARIGDLKSSFLAAFAVFGYRFAFDPRLNRVREQILNPTRKQLSRFWIVQEEIPNWTGGILIGSEPLSAVWVWHKNVAVMMPWLDSPMNFYEFLAANFSGSQRVTMSGHPIPWPTRMEFRLDLIERG